MKVVNINGKAYMIDPFKGKQGFKIKAEVVKLIAPIFSAMLIENKDENAKVEVDDKGNIVRSIDWKNLSTCIEHVFETADIDKLLDLAVELVSQVKTESGYVDFDKEFSQNYLTLYKLIQEVIVVNYGDVFQALGMNVG